MPAIVFTDADGDRTVLALKPRSRHAIGSDPACSLSLNDPMVAPRHCEVAYEFGLWQIRDLRSPAGTLVNGDWVAEGFSLADGDMIRLGDSLLVFEEGPARTAAPNPAGRARSSGRPAAGRPAAPGRPRSTRTRRRARIGSSRAPVAPIVVGAAVGVAAIVVFSMAPGGGRPGGEATATREIARVDTPEPAAAIELIATPRAPSPVSVTGAKRDEASRKKPDAVDPAASGEARADTPRLTDLIREAESGVVRLEPRDRTDRTGEPGAPSPDFDGAGADVDEREHAESRAPEIASDPMPALIALDFETAVELAGTAEASLREEIERARDALNALHAGIDAAIKRRASFQIARDVTMINAAPAGEIRAPVGGARRVRIARREGRLVTLADGSGKPLGVFPMLALPDDTLVELASSGGDSASAPRRLESLARLLLWARGPRRATVFVAGHGELAGTLDGAIEDAVASWPDLGTRSLESAYGKLGGDSSPGDWAVLACGALTALDAIPDENRFGAARERASTLFLEARSKSIPIDTLFHGELTLLDDGRVRVRHDFTGGSSDALRRAVDLLAVGPDTQPAKIARGKLVLQGEYRLLSREPFVNRLSVRGSAVPLAGDAPNVNVALWTSSADAITCLDGETTTWIELLREERGEPADWFVFGMGYRAVVCSAYEQPSEQVTPVDTGESIQLPGLVVLAGERGSPLHKDLGECLLAKSTATAVQKRTAFEIDWSPGAVTWSVNGTPVKLDSPHFMKRLRAKPARRGSVTIFTNGRPVILSGLEVTGELDPEWIKESARARAIEELD